MSTPETIALTYAPPPRGTRRRRWLRRAFLLAWAGVTVWQASRTVWPWGVAKVELLRAERACFGHREPADRVVFEPNPARAAQLVGGSGYRLTADGPLMNGRVAVYTGLESRRKRFRDAVGELESEVRRYSPPDPDAEPPLLKGDWRRNPPDDFVWLFAHELTSSRGETRLVLVGANWFGQAGSFLFDAEVYAPGAWREGPSRREVRVWEKNDRGLLLSPRAPDDLIRLYAGQPDPADASRFTVRYETLSGGSGTMVGRLRDDGGVDGVVEGPLNGPRPEWLQGLIGG